MFNKVLILIGRTFIATFILVNFFNIIPINYSSNAWFVQVSMLLVDTSSLLLLGLSSLKLASFLSIKSESESEHKNPSKEQSQKYKNNINVINKFSFYSMYIFVFIALLQAFVVFNGLSQLHFIYSERVLKLEKQHQISQNKLESELNINLENNTNSRAAIQNRRDKVLQVLTDQKNSAMSYLVRDAIKVFLMSLVWAYGFLKLSKFA